MPETDFSIKEYLETCTEAAKRVRFATIILMVVTVLVLAGYLNSFELSWSFLRIDFHNEMDMQLADDQRRLECVMGINANTVGCGALSGQTAANITSKAKCGNTVCDDPKVIKEDIEKLECYRCAKDNSADLLRALRRSVVDNSYSIKVPFFGTSFDINDLGLIGGLSLVIVLMMSRLSLRTYIVSLRVAKKAAVQTNLVGEFYDILASRQLFVFPSLVDWSQHNFKGKTELWWDDSILKKFIHDPIKGAFRRLKGGFWWVLRKIVRADDPAPDLSTRTTDVTSDHWRAHPQPYLKRLPKMISLIPFFVYLLVVINDFRSFSDGMDISKSRTLMGSVSNVLCLILILAFGCWNVSKWFEIDRLWENFARYSSNMTARGSGTPTKQRK